MADNGQNGIQLRKPEKDKKTKNAVYAQRYRDKIRADPELHRLQKLKDQARNQRRKANLTEEQAARQREQARERTRLCRARKKEKASSSTHQTPVASNTRRQTRRNVREQENQRQKWREQKAEQRKNWSGQKRRHHREAALEYYYTHKRKQTCMSRHSPSSYIFECQLRLPPEEATANHVGSPERLCLA